ncbi:MAG: S8 family serine peptidase [bacterium]|nr:S8 family serine peptidase [bacterium]
MKKTIFLAFLFIIGLILAGVTWASSQNSKSERAEGQVLVKFKPTLIPQVREAIIGSHGGKVIEKIDALGVLTLSVPAGTEDKVVAALSKNPHVEYAEPNYLAFAVLTPNDPYFAPNQWGLENTAQVIKEQIGLADADIDAPAAWDVTTGVTIGGIKIKVAILDSGIDQNHEDISSKIVAQRNFTTSSTTDDIYGHGTHVGGTVAAITNNGVGVAGGCPDCVLMNGKVLGDNGSGAYSWVAGGIIWAADNGAKVINLSLGGNSPSKTLESAVNYAWSKGAVVVAAAGNCGCQSKIYPAAYKNVIAVAATNNQDKKASFSSYGAKWVDVAAPGENIFSTFPNHPFVIQTTHGRSQNYDFASGTSMATPMTSAAAALIWSTPYGTSAQAVRSRLETTAEKIGGTGTYWSAGRINAGFAVSP